MELNRYAPFTSIKEILEQYDKRTNKPCYIGGMFYKFANDELAQAYTFHIERPSSKDSFYNEKNIKTIERIINKFSCAESLYWDDRVRIIKEE